MPDNQPGVDAGRVIAALQAKLAEQITQNTVLQLALDDAHVNLRSLAQRLGETEGQES